MKTLVAINVFLFVHAIGFSQSLAELQQKRNMAAREITEITRLLEKTREKENASFNRLQLLNQTVIQRNLIISGLSAELEVYQEFIDNNSLVVEMLSADMKKLKKEYAGMIRLAHQQKYFHDGLMYLLSAESFNQAYRRYLYMKRYASFRKKQAGTIEVIQSLLDEKVVELEKLKQKHTQLIEQANRERAQMNREKERQKAELQALKDQEAELQQKLNEQKRIELQLEREIERMIAEEVRKNREAGSPAYALTPDQQLLGDRFEKNKQRLPWPVERGIITDKFGIHQHPVLSHVQVRNNGINIATEAEARVRAVFNGVVSRVFGITGGNSAVIIRHGKYLSVYSNLKEVAVKKGDKVVTNQPVGTVYTDYDEAGKSILKFQIWHENQKLNPEEWLGR